MTITAFALLLFKGFIQFMVMAMIASLAIEAGDKEKRQLYRDRYNKLKEAIKDVR